jgi:cupin 2 domain-containing protein
MSSLHKDSFKEVLILKGNARLKLESKEISLQKGESLLIPANIKHWVTYTHNPTIWLAVHIKG